MTRSIQRHPAKQRSRRARWLAGTALAALAAPSIAHAQAVWNGTNSTDWFDAGNWTPNAVPSNATDATIDTISPNSTVVGSGAASARNLAVGNGAGTAGRLTVTGAGTTLTSSGSFAVGGAGTGALVVQNGGVVNSSIGLISIGAGSAATVTGAGSRWTSFRQTVDGTLNILNGGELLNTGQFRIGTNTQSANVTVDGAGSTLTKAGGAIFVDSGTLTVSNGGAVAGGVGFISGRVTVTGAGSRWTTSSYFEVGGSFTVSSGGTVSSSRSVITGSSLNAAQLTVTGAGSRWNSNETIVGQGFGGTSGYGTLNVLNGGFVSSLVGVLGDTLNGIGQATIDGTTSRWTMSDTLTLGNESGASGTMTLRNGGTASAGAVRIAQSTQTAGTLNIGAASGAAAAAPGTLDAPTVAFGAGSGRIVFNHTSSGYTFAPVISGSGTLLFEAGTTTFTGNSTTFTGNAIVNGGTLLANGSIAASTTTVNAGGTLGGSGSVGNTTINGGTLSPGNSIGTLNVQGNLVLTAAATYLVEVDPNGADRTNVSGTATLGGATVRATYASGSYVSRRYIIVSAGAISGTFNTLVNTNLPANFAATLNYDATNVYLDVALASGSGQNLNGNQRSVANALANSFNATGGISLVFGALTAQGLTQVSGEAATGTQQTTFNAMDQFVGMMTDPFWGTRAGGAPQASASGYADEDDALAYAARKKRTGAEREAYAAFKAPPRASVFERRWSVWGAGYGGTQKTDGNAATGSNDVTSRIYGGAAGFDYRLSPDTLIGFSLGGAGTNYGLASGLGNGRSEMFQAGLYGRHTFGAAYLAGALAYGWQNVTTDRNVFGNVYRANFDASSFAGRLEGGYRFAFGASGLTPYAAGQVTSFFLPGYSESVAAGVNTFALAYADKDVTATRTELGLRGDTSFAAQDAIITLRGRAAWAHNFNTERSVGVIFQTLPASAFVVNGAAQARDSALVSAGAEARWLNGFSVAATFEGEFSNVTESYAGKGTLRYQW